MKGLCGTFNPALQFSDVYTTASGTVGWYPSSRWGGPFGGTFQTEFVESWRVAPGSNDALFTEAECPTGTPTIPTDPPELFANCPEKRAQAEANCPQGRFYESCLTDVGVTCNDAWVTHCGGSNDDFTDIDDGDIDTPEDPGVPANQLPPGPPATGRTRTLMRTNPPLNIHKHRRMACRGLAAGRHGRGDRGNLNPRPVQYGQAWRGRAQGGDRPMGAATAADSNTRRHASPPTPYGNMGGWV